MQESAQLESIARLRRDSDPTTWVFALYDASRRKWDVIRLGGSGPDSAEGDAIAALMAAMRAVETPTVMMALFRVQEVFESV